jgi:hypothetical protein
MSAFRPSQEVPVNSNQSFVSDRLDALEREHASSLACLHKARNRFRLLSGLAGVFLLGGLILFSAKPAVAQGQSGHSVEARLAALESRMTAVEAVNASQASQINAMQATEAAQAAQISTLQGEVATQSSQIATLQTSDSNQNGRLTSLESADYVQDGQITALQNSDGDQNSSLVDLVAKTQFVSVLDGQMYISGTNLHVNNGMGATESSNGLGNLIIGYNELRPIANTRTGSHYLILGSMNNYQSYAGIVAGSTNTGSGAYASVVGGFTNRAAGSYSTVSGGKDNRADGFYSGIAGGWGGRTSGDSTMVSGGTGNWAAGDFSSVSGGFENRAGAEGSSVSGGSSNRANGIYSSISGGPFITQTDLNGWSGGTLHSP